MFADPQPDATPSERMPEPNNDWWFYAIVAVLFLLAVGFVIHILRSGVI